MTSPKAKKEKIWGAPGCGKTSTLMSRYTDLLDDGFSYNDITVTTFRKSSAGDLINAVIKNTGAKVADVSRHVGTLHSICYRLIGGSIQPVVEKSDRNKFLKDYGYAGYNQQKITEGDEDGEQSGNLFDFAAWMDNTQTPASRWYTYPSSSSLLLPEKKIPDFLIDWEDFKQNIGKIDFSDMPKIVMDEGIELDTPALMVDEFQDLSYRLFNTFVHLTKSCEHIVIAGDPLQSIYGYGGGSPDYYLNYKASETVLNFSYRLSNPIWEVAKLVLKVEKMEPPKTIRARNWSGNAVSYLSAEDPYPIHDTELHLVRCNFQKWSIAMKLADEGKPFAGTSYGWTDSQVELFNAIIKYLSGATLKKSELKTLIVYFPLVMFSTSDRTKKDLIERVSSSEFKNQLNTDSGLITRRLHNRLMSHDPLGELGLDKLLRLKIYGALRKRRNEITLSEVHKRRLMTIHAAKGAEADGVFLHTEISPKIRDAILIPGEESQAEARVWYVGVTRPKEALYIIQNRRLNYTIPEICIC